MKCAIKETAKAGTGVPCATKAASKMVTNYDTKLQKKCAGATCAASYPDSVGGGCASAFHNGAPGADELFGSLANPPDLVTGDAIDLVEPVGCNY
jgi:hypothetical protein